MVDAGTNGKLMNFKGVVGRLEAAVLGMLTGH